MLALDPSLARLPFRGDRNYLHSTDLYPALTEFSQKQFSPDAFVENLTIRQAVSHQVRVKFDGPGSSFGSFRVRHGVSQTRGWLVETDEPVLSRIPFDEITATGAAIRGPGFALFRKSLPHYSMFELLLILTKIVAGQENTQHWWLCQIDFHAPLRPIFPLECRLQRKISQRYLTLHVCQAHKAISLVRAMAAPRAAAAARDAV